MARARGRYSHMHVAETHERAAARHAAAAATFQRLGDSVRAEHERTLAYDQRRKADIARQRALAELVERPTDDA